MTLVTRAKPPAHHKKLSGRHHRRTKDYHKAYWPYLPMLLIVAGGLLLNMSWAPKHGVLAYATDVSIQELLDGTNSQRSANGLGGLSLNSLLDQAAQNKANDMVARDYWSHDTPDGQTPWSFYDAVGYQYQTAGENLAYGFDTASDTITGWMNSPGHRANILNTTYQEVGFGIANSPNYVGTGPETVIVAEYAEPVGGVAPASTPAPASTVPSSSPSSEASPPASQPVVSEPVAPAPAPAASNDKPAPVAADSQPVKTATPVKPIVEAKPVKVSRLQELTAGKAPWSVTAATILMASGFLIFFMRHGIAWHRVIRKGERFFLKHPILDIAMTLFLVVGLLLTHSVGSIR